METQSTKETPTISLTGEPIMPIMGPSEKAEQAIMHLSGIMLQ